MKDIVTPVPPEEVRAVIKKCLENAALVNYTRVSEYAKIEGEKNEMQQNIKKMRIKDVTNGKTERPWEHLVSFLKKKF